MSIRRVNKNQLKKNAGVQLVGREHIEPPSVDDPLVFWTLHHKTPIKVDLRPFATGQGKCPTGRSTFESFSGRQALIAQLLPALKETILYRSIDSVRNYLGSLRAWWRVLDRVETDAENAGESMSRVMDVRLLTNMHAEAAHRAEMGRGPFNAFRAVVDMTRVALGSTPTFWESPERDPQEKHIPPEELRKALRIEIKRQCRQVLEHWAICDTLKLRASAPNDPALKALWRAVRHLHDVQQQSGRLLPSALEINCGKGAVWTHNNLGVGVKTIRATMFPDHQDAWAIFTQCLINTGWNASTLLALDVNKRFLFDHFKDKATDPHRRWVLTPVIYELVGEKERAGGKEQVVFGMWKTKDGAGYLIKSYLARVEPLREILKAQLADATQQYKKLQEANDQESEISALFTKIKSLQRGCASVWLYVGQKGEIAFLDTKHACSDINGKQVHYLEYVLYHLNADRVARNEAPIPKVELRDLRVWFADYVYRRSYGNILAVKNALNHSQLSTSKGYVNTNILNKEASDSARRFLTILVDELDRGRVDLTILAHLYRYGPLAPEQEIRLAELRALPRSRQGIACKDAHHPPAHMKATTDGTCDIQRCLLCVENAVLLPESIDGIAMREAELRALQSFLAATIWVTDRYDIELKNHELALRRFNLCEVMAARRKWAEAISCGKHLVPGIPPEQVPKFMELT